MNKSAIPPRYNVLGSAISKDTHNSKAIDAAQRCASLFVPGEERIDGTGENARKVYVVAKYPTRGLVLNGLSGRGKSTVLGALMVYVEQKGFQCRWIHWDELLFLLGSFEKDEKSKLRDMERCHALVIDDLAQSIPSTHVATALHGFVERRYRENLPIFATTSAKDSELSAALGAAVVSRLHQMADAVELTGPDRRRS